MSLYRMTPAVAALLADPRVQVFLVLDFDHDIRLDLLIRAEQSIPTLEYGRVYTLREIADAEWWDANLPIGQRIEGGETFAFLVALRQFDLEFACCTHRTNKRYRRL